MLGPPATDTLAPAMAAPVTELVTLPPIEPVVDTRAKFLVAVAPALTVTEASVWLV